MWITRPYPLLPTPVSSAERPPPAPGNTPCVSPQQQTPVRHTAQSPQRFPRAPPTPPPPLFALCTTRPPPHTTPCPPLPAAPPDQPQHSQSHPRPSTLKVQSRSPCPQQNPATCSPPPPP